jgi:hypothetical protein
MRAVTLAELPNNGAVVDDDASMSFAAFCAFVCSLKDGVFSFGQHHSEHTAGEGVFRSAQRYLQFFFDILLFLAAKAFGAVSAYKVYGYYRITQYFFS